MSLPSSVMITSSKVIKLVKQIFQHYNETVGVDEYSIYFKDENRDVIWGKGQVELYQALNDIR